MLRSWPHLLPPKNLGTPSWFQFFSSLTSLASCAKIIGSKFQAVEKPSRYSVLGLIFIRLVYTRDTGGLFVKAPIFLPEPCWYILKNTPICVYIIYFSAKDAIFLVLGDFKAIFFKFQEIIILFTESSSLLRNHILPNKMVENRSNLPDMLLSRGL